MKEITFNSLKKWKISHSNFSEIYQKPVSITGKITLLTDIELIEDMKWSKERQLKDVISYALYDQNDSELSFPVFIGDSIDNFLQFEDGILIKISGEFGSIATTKTCIGKISSVERLSDKNKD